MIETNPGRRLNCFDKLFKTNKPFETPLLGLARSLHKLGLTEHRKIFQRPPVFRRPLSMIVDHTGPYWNLSRFLNRFTFSCIASFTIRQVQLKVLFNFVISVTLSNVTKIIGQLFLLYLGLNFDFISLTLVRN